MFSLSISYWLIHWVSIIRVTVVATYIVVYLIIYSHLHQTITLVMLSLIDIWRMYYFIWSSWVIIIGWSITVIKAALFVGGYLSCSISKLTFTSCMFFFHHVVKTNKILYHLSILWISISATHTSSSICHHCGWLETTTRRFIDLAIIFITSIATCLGSFLILNFSFNWIW